MMDDTLTMSELAQRGLACEKKIDEMLDDIWRAFETLEPILAKWLVALFGSAEFAALMIMGRFKGQPSILEALSTKPLSEDDIKRVFDLSPTFFTQKKEGPVCLSHQANDARKKYQNELVEIFKKLKEVDPEVASAAFELWDNVDDAAEYLAMPVRGLGGKSPLEVLDDGDRDQVLCLLYRLQHGSYP